MTTKRTGHYTGLLNSDERLFLERYLQDRDGYATAIDLGQPEHRARTYAASMLRRPRVALALTEMTQQRYAALGARADEVIGKMAAIAFGDPRRLVDDDGTPLPLHQLPDDVVPLIEGLEIDTRWEGVGDDREAVGERYKYKLASRASMLTTLARHLGLLTDKIQVDVSYADEIAAAIAKARAYEGEDG